MEEEQTTQWPKEKSTKGQTTNEGATESRLPNGKVIISTILQALSWLGQP